MLTRRRFGLGLTSAAFSGLALAGCSKLQRIPDFRTAQMRRFNGYGPLVPDPAGLFDLPDGFRYSIISSFGDPGIEGADQVPSHADGMGAFRIDHRLMALVRNHELSPGPIDGKGPFLRPPAAQVPAYDSSDGMPLPGGTTTIIYDYVAHRVERQYLSLVGTVRNCAGGVTPWGSWLSCEETVEKAGQGLGEDHGWVFEVPAGSEGLVERRPLAGLGRFKHEAAVVDPATGIVYLTEDEIEGLFYRFVPDACGVLGGGGRLEALALAGPADGIDSRNWSGRELPMGIAWPVRWVPLSGEDNPHDDLRKRGHAESGATRFACGEGVHLGVTELGQTEIYFCCTSGGEIKSGQIMRYRPSPKEGQGEAPERDEPGTLELFLESTDPATFNFGDNLTVAPNGHLMVCEDPYFGGQSHYLLRDPLARWFGMATECYIRGVTPAGSIYDFARITNNSELTGICFSPDGRTMFVNIYDPAKTLAITGPWHWQDPRPNWGLPDLSNCPGR